MRCFKTKLSRGIIKRGIMSNIDSNFIFGAVSGFSSSFLGPYLHDYVTQQRLQYATSFEGKVDRVREIVNLKAPSRSFYDIGSDTIVPPVKALVGMVNSILWCEGGVLVIGAPPNSGKTTYLKMAVRALSCNQELKKPIIWMESPTEKSLDWLTDITGQDFVEYLPDETVLIFDQVDNTTVTEEFKIFLKTLATKSINHNIAGTNKKKFHSILIVSCANVMEIVLLLNGGKKFFSLFHSNDFIWQSAEKLHYIKEYCRVNNVSNENEQTLLLQKTACTKTAGNVRDQIFDHCNRIKFGKKPLDLDNENADWEKFSKSSNLYYEYPEINRIPSYFHDPKQILKDGLLYTCK